MRTFSLPLSPRDASAFKNRDDVTDGAPLLRGGDAIAEDAVVEKEPICVVPSMLSDSAFEGDICGGAEYVNVRGVVVEGVVVEGVVVEGVVAECAAGECADAKPSISGVEVSGRAVSVAVEEDGEDDEGSCGKLGMAARKSKVRDRI